MADTIPPTGENKKMLNLKDNLYKDHLENKEKLPRYDHIIEESISECFVKNDKKGTR